MFHEGMFEHFAGLHPLTRWLIIVVLTFLLSLLVAIIARAVLLTAVKRSRHIDHTLARFLKTVITASVVVFVALATLYAAGLPATALGGIIAAAGLVLGFALRDTLGNLAAGVVLLINRPYNIGEVVTVKGHEGTVTDLGIAMTRVKTFDGRYVTVPNGSVLDDAILNWTRNPTRRVEITVDVAYEDDLEGAIETAVKTAKDQPKTQAEPAPDVLVSDLGDNGVRLIVRAWVETPEWLTTWTDLRRRLKIELEKAGYTIPFPQRDVHMIDAGSSPLPKEDRGFDPRGTS